MLKNKISKVSQQMFEQTASNVCPQKMIFGHMTCSSLLVLGVSSVHAAVLV